jgi:ACR3 family arsenite transporter
MSFFEKYLSVWVLACMALGVAVAQFLPGVPGTLGKWEYAHVNLPVAILIWVMIYPMMLKVDFHALKGVRSQPQGIAITLVVNWLVKPFTMFAITWLFVKVLFAPWIDELKGTEYVAGAVLLGAAPCTAMVFVWSYLTKGDAAFTLVQVALNDLIMLVAYAPIVMFLLGIGGVTVPFDTVLLSVGLYVVVPLAAGWFSRVALVRAKGKAWFDNQFVPAVGKLPVYGLLLTLVLLFSFQGATLQSHWLHILLLAVPLTLQTFVNFGIAFGASRLLKVPHSIAGPSALIGGSNFFELAVAVAISLFGLTSGAALATVVGVLVEVPVMLALVVIVNRSRLGWPTKATITGAS